MQVFPIKPEDSSETNYQSVNNNNNVKFRDAKLKNIGRAEPRECA